MAWKELGLGECVHLVRATGRSIDRVLRERVRGLEVEALVIYRAT